MNIHRTLDGGWAKCADATCELLFHVEDMTLAEAEQIPLETLLPLFEIVQPPSDIFADGTKVWNLIIPGGFRRHRDYDLPASVGPEGMFWFQHGVQHRVGDKPSTVKPDGTKFWVENGELHREGGKPAMIWADGTLEYYEHGNPLL